jgi:hypothetical protein
MGHLKESPMAFHLALNPPELNPRLKRQPASEEGLYPRYTVSTLWKEIGNSRLRVQNHSIHSSSQANEANSNNRRQR